MRAKRFEKLLERKKKKVLKAQEKIEHDDLVAKESKYTNPDGTIDWDRLAKHISEAISGR
jgi:hypothetical protein